MHLGYISCIYFFSRLLKKCNCLAQLNKIFLIKHIENIAQVWLKRNIISSHRRKKNFIK
jgi:antibiotic biosynthesis monooxygenase (ABM) superfamily enzyme